MTQERNGSGEQTARRLDRQCAISASMDYLLYLPSNYAASPTEQFPLLLFLHGAGERGSDLERVKHHGPPRLASEGRQFPFIIASPQCPAEDWWHGHLLRILLDELLATLRIDTERLYLTGMSMGGYGTWEMAMMYPDLFAAIAPICGGGNPYWVRRIKRVPAWAFHGGKDPVVPLEKSEEMVAALQSAGGDARLTVYPDAGHDSWTQTYNNPDLYTWLLRHTRA